MLIAKSPYGFHRLYCQLIETNLIPLFTVHIVNRLKVMLMAGVLSIEERAKIASRYEVWQAIGNIIQVHRWWRTQNGRNTSLNARTIKIAIKTFLKVAV